MLFERFITGGPGETAYKQLGTHNSYLWLGSVCSWRRGAPFQTAYLYLFLVKEGIQKRKLFRFDVELGASNACFWNFREDFKLPFLRVFLHGMPPYRVRIVGSSSDCVFWSFVERMPQSGGVQVGH